MAGGQALAARTAHHDRLAVSGLATVRRPYTRARAGQRASRTAGVRILEPPTLAGPRRRSSRAASTSAALRRFRVLATRAADMVATPCAASVGLGEYAVRWCARRPYPRPPRAAQQRSDDRRADSPQRMRRG